MKKLNKPKRYYLKITTKYFQGGYRVDFNDINPNEYWEKFIFDKNDHLVYYERSTGYWSKREYDQNGNEIYFENSYGYWIKMEYDNSGNQTYWENSDGSSYNIT